MAKSLQDELEALRRELQSVMPASEDAATADAATEAPPGNMRAEIERVLRELQTRMGETIDDAEDIVVAHPFASVAAAFLLGILVANFMSRGR